jgi:hypothetical protein
VDKEGTGRTLVREGPPRLYPVQPELKGQVNGATHHFTGGKGWNEITVTPAEELKKNMGRILSSTKAEQETFVPVKYTLLRS